MLKNEDLVSIYNRHSNGTCGYTIPEMNGLHRNFAPGEVKKVPMEELRKLDWVPGGHAMLRDHLIIMNEEAVEEILGVVEPEYYYTKNDIEKLLLQGTLDELEDCLNFAPEGVVELVKDLAIAINLNNTDKRKIIERKTGVNVDRAIRVNEEVAADLKEPTTSAEVKTRKAAQPVTSADVNVPTRKSAAPKYKIVENN